MDSQTLMDANMLFFSLKTADFYGGKFIWVTVSYFHIKIWTLQSSVTFPNLLWVCNCKTLVCFLYWMKMNVKIYLNTDESVVIGSFAVYMYMSSIKITILVTKYMNFVLFCLQISLQYYWRSIPLTSSSIGVTNIYYRSNIL